MTSGCIGVSGLRGSGKTTLIRDFCAHRYGSPRNPPREGEPTPLRGLRFVIDAPQKFDPRDFLIYLYTHLCRTVLTDVRFATAASRGRLLDTVLLSRRIRVGALLPALTGLVFLALAAGLAYQSVVGVWPVVPWRHPFFWEVTGTVASALVTVVVLGWRTRQGLKVVRQVTDLPAEAVERLRQLQFQRTDSVTRGGTIAGPFGIGVNVGDSRSLTENVMSLPELIADYRDFVERVVAALMEAEERAARDQKAAKGGDDADAAAVRAATAVRLVIGVDSMDQIENPAEACMFLDELSAVFGTPHCVYLLAIKPSTLAAVDQRTVPLKTSSGGLFDEMVWVEALTLGQAAGLLDYRVTGMPGEFIALCYVLSGGLPRELLRVARAVCASSDPVRGISLADATTSVINDEIQALRHRAMASAASLDIGATPEWLKLVAAGDWLLRREERQQQTVDAPVIQALFNKLSHPWGDSGPHTPSASAGELCDSLIADLYFLHTVSELFTGDPSVVTGLLDFGDSPAPPPASGDVGGQFPAPSSHVLQALASARAELSVNPYLAANHVGVARCALVGATSDTALTDVIELPFLRSDAGGTGMLAR